MNTDCVRNRVLNLDGVHNFRDYGGYPVSGGGRLKRGVLWRSGQHVRASDADLERITEIGLVSVFDLRNPRERSTHPCRRPEGFGGKVHFSDASAYAHAPHVAAARAAGERSPATMRGHLLSTYKAIAFRPELQAMTRSLIAEAAEGNGPSLVNCLAGKDRTGIAVAMVQLAAGVHHDDVIEDYLLTNTAGDSEARIAEGSESIVAMMGPLDDASLRVLLGVEPEYLDLAFAAIGERHGSVDSYLADALGADDAMRGKLREALVEG